MPSGKDQSHEDRFVALVVLRTVSGKSIQDIGEHPLPEDLSPYRVSPEAHRRVVRVFERLGFGVFADSSGATLSIEGSLATFERVFGIAPARLGGVRAVDTVRLTPPAEIQTDIDDIMVLPKPALFP